MKAFDGEKSKEVKKLPFLIVFVKKPGAQS